MYITSNDTAMLNAGKGFNVLIIVGIYS